MDRQMEQVVSPARHWPKLFDKRDVLVLTGGFTTTALAFTLAWFADRQGERLMGNYGLLWGVIPIPIGALLIGALSAAGYGGASYLTQRKVSGRLLWLVMFLLLGSYFGAQYVEYRQ